MNVKSEAKPFVAPIDDEHEHMMIYARSAKGLIAIERAQSEIANGKGIVADDAYFDALKQRRFEKLLAK